MTDVLPLNRLAFEMRCLTRSLNVTKNGGVSRFAKAVLLILLGVWAVLVLDLTAADPSQLLLYSLTALIFSIVGRLWRLEAEYWLSKINPITITLGDDDE
ncbi:hypothetical protein OSG_eHP14_00030 [environmental Halophage eHP-14]|nr:hypothetical protein OSG_eHP14_00030 [environmental Halophage eHP-14]